MDLISARLPAAMLAILLAAGLVTPVAAVRAEPPARVAVFDLELVDTSLQAELQGADAADLARLELITDELRRALDQAPRYEVVDTAPAASEIEAAGYLRSCNGCELDIAKQLGAELALIGWVQKVSNLILNINLQMRDVATGELVFGASVDIRGNTDQSWLRGIRYLIEHRLLGQ